MARWCRLLGTFKMASPLCVVVRSPFLDALLFLDPLFFYIHLILPHFSWQWVSPTRAAARRAFSCSLRTSYLFSDSNSIHLLFTFHLFSTSWKSVIIVSLNSTPLYHHHVTLGCVVGTSHPYPSAWMDGVSMAHPPCRYHTLYARDTLITHLHLYDFAFLSRPTHTIISTTNHSSAFIPSSTVTAHHHRLLLILRDLSHVFATWSSLFGVCRERQLLHLYHLFYKLYTYRSYLSWRMAQSSSFTLHHHKNLGLPFFCSSRQSADDQLSAQPHQRQ